MNLKRLSFVLLICLAAGASAYGQETQPEPTADPNAIQLTLEDAIEMALENNLDIVVSRLDTQVQAEGVRFARGVYQPFISGSFNNLDSSSPAQTQLVGAQTLTSTRTNYNVTWQQEISTGANYSVTWQNLRSTTNSAFAGFNPLYDAAITGQIAQPILSAPNDGGMR